MSQVSIVGILNLTPDSSFDGGKWTLVEAAVAQAKKCISGGADWIELGAESTGPDSVEVSADEELKRLIPTLQAVRRALPNARISVDTYKAEVADEALKLGASMINDVTAGRADSRIFAIVARHHCPIVLMYAKDPSPRTTREDRQYEDVIATVRQFLTERRSAALAAGIAPNRIIVDPGLGHFVSADARYSWELLASLDRFRSLGRIFVSPSRKSFLAGPQNLPVNERLPATLAATTIAVLHGASYIRTHDVWETRRVVASFTRRTSSARSSPARSSQIRRTDR